jgi:predicted nucleic acid-binding protein
LIFNAIESRLFSGVILDITILNIDYIANKQVKDVKEFLKLVNKHFEVVGASNEMIEQALKIDNKDLEDNLQYLSAINSKCEIVITNDKSFYTKDIETVSSSEFVQRYLK